MKSFQNTIIIDEPEIFSVHPRFTKKELMFDVTSDVLSMVILFTFSERITNLCVETKKFKDKDFSDIAKETGFYRHGPNQILRYYDYSRFIESIRKDMKEGVPALLSEFSAENNYDIPKLIALYVLKKIELNEYNDVLPMFPIDYNPTSVHSYFKYTGKTLTKDLAMFYARHMEELKCGKYFLRLHQKTLENWLKEKTFLLDCSQKTAMHRVLNSDVFVYIFFFTACIGSCAQFLCVLYLDIYS